MAGVPLKDGGAGRLTRSQVARAIVRAKVGHVLNFAEFDGGLKADVAAAKARVLVGAAAPSRRARVVSSFFRKKARLATACLDEGLLSLTPSNLLYVESPYNYKKYR